VQEKNRMYLIMEYCAGGDLAGYLRRSKRLPEAAAQALMQQLGAGLKVLRDNNLVHVRAPGHFCSQRSRMPVFLSRRSEALRLRR
jgi:uncharacterized membrane protein